MGILSEIPETYRIPALLLLGTSIFLLVNRAKSSKAKIPFVGTWSSDFISVFFARLKFVSHARSMLEGGYSKYRDTPFQIPTNSSTRVVLPPRHIEEVRNYPNSKLSFMASSYEFMQGEQIGFHLLAHDSPTHAKVVRSQLTSNLPKLIDPLVDESKYAFEVEIGSAKDWKSICLHSALVRVVARISSRIFVNESICRDEDWLRISIKFTEDIFSNAFLMTAFPVFLRPLATAVLPFGRRIKHHREQTRRLLGSIYEQRLADREAQKPKVEDVFGWMVGHAKPEWQNVTDLADFHLLLAMSAIHTTTAALDNTIYDLLEQPEYIEAIREEIIQAVTEDGGKLTKSTMAKMMKMDSFLKESQRHNSALFSFSRKALESFNLSDGTHIPAGTKVTAAAHSLCFDPQYVENPKEFDGYRYYKLRQKAEEFNKHTFTSPSTTELNFGYGAHVCPGRFFAANEIQIVLIRLLMKYELKFPEGERRPKNWSLGEVNQPSTVQKVMLKERADVPDWDFL